MADTAELRVADVAADPAVSGAPRVVAWFSNAAARAFAARVNAYLPVARNDA